MNIKCVTRRWSKMNVFDGCRSNNTRLQHRLRTSFVSQSLVYILSFTHALIEVARCDQMMCLRMEMKPFFINPINSNPRIILHARVKRKRSNVPKITKKERTIQMKSRTINLDQLNELFSMNTYQKRKIRKHQMTSNKMQRRTKGPNGWVPKWSLNYPIQLEYKCVFETKTRYKKRTHLDRR